MGNMFVSIITLVFTSEQLIVMKMIPIITNQYDKYGDSIWILDEVDQ
jgi:hypothetical protein